jgi:hypothetical protein
VELPAHSDRLQLRLFLTALNRSQMGQKTSYTYSLEGNCKFGNSLAARHSWFFQRGATHAK